MNNPLQLNGQNLTIDVWDMTVGYGRLSIVEV